MDFRTFALVASFAVLSASCGDAPRPASPQSALPPASTAPGALPPGHPSLNELPPGHPQVAGASSQRAELTDPSQFAGVAVLKGELANATQGRLMVTLRQKGQSGPKMPLWAYVVDLDDPEVEKKGLMPARDGQREFMFVLNKDTTILPSPLPKNVALEVELRFDLDGSVDTRDDAYFAVVDTVRGDTQLELVLEKPTQQ